MQPLPGLHGTGAARSLSIPNVASDGQGGQINAHVSMLKGGGEGALHVTAKRVYSHDCFNLNSLLSACQ